MDELHVRVAEYTWQVFARCGGGYMDLAAFTERLRKRSASVRGVGSQRRAHGVPIRMPGSLPQGSCGNYASTVETYDDSLKFIEPYSVRRVVYVKKFASDSVSVQSKNNFAGR